MTIDSRGLKVKVTGYANAVSLTSTESEKITFEGKICRTRGINEQWSIQALTLENSTICDIRSV